MSQHGPASDHSFVSPTRGGATLSSLVAAQRSEELARMVEKRSRVALALATRHHEDPGGWQTSAATMLASVQVTARRLAAALRPRIGHTLDAHASRADARARTAPSGPDSQLVCCA